MGHDRDTPGGPEIDGLRQPYATLKFDRSAAGFLENPRSTVESTGMAGFV
ncbi:hypothetical protein HNQ75_003969 [Rhizobium flavum]|uniref:Uncharacterized protein n=1 Tax=Pseudorhizobium flavum TaxID=1335061 RepID=A0A7W9Z2J3_9HYPH|nr:hypothetical protein [Pseudorhizobium flavum]CAD6631440.1 hypothetical protein RFYW14_04507 [Pseudorhizobium flavum]